MSRRHSNKRVTDPKDARLDIRLKGAEKRKFYKLCDQYGLCPSDVIGRWIHRFILNSRSIKQAVDSVVLHPKNEVYSEVSDYMSGGEIPLPPDELKD